MTVWLNQLLHLSQSLQLTFTGHTVLAGTEENEKSQLGADEAFAWPGRCRKDQVGHSVGCSVDTPQAGAT